MPRSIDVAPRTWCRVAGVRMKKRRPPFPVRVGLVAGWVAACASTTAGVDGSTPDIVTPDVGDAAVDRVADAPMPPLWPQPDPAAPRLIAPLSCTWHSSRRPTLRWERPAGVERVVVEVCADRPCQRVEQTLEASGDTVRVPEELRPGVHFWRAFALRDGQRGPASFTWEFRAPFRSAPSDTATTTYVDVNGDGYGDAVFHAGRGAYVYFGGTGGFGGSPAQFFPLPGGGRAFADLGDLNGDGYSDVALYHYDSSVINPPVSLRVYVGSAAGLRPTDHVVNKVPEGQISTGFAFPLGDINRDGYADIASTTDSQVRENVGLPLQVWIHLSSRDGYSRAQTFEFINPSPSTRRFGNVRAIGDFDGDGRIDLVALGRMSPERNAATHYIVPWDEASSSSARPWVLRAPPGYETGDASEDMHRGYCDLNGDGVVEALAPIYRLDSVGGFPLGQIGVFEHRSGDTFILDTSVIRLSERGVGGITLSCVPDLNGDGYTDVVGSHVEPDNEPVNWFILGNPSGRYQAVRYDNDAIDWISGTAQFGNDANGDGGSDCLFSRANAPARLFSYSRDRGTLALAQSVRDPTLSDSDAGFKPIFGSPFLF